MISGCMSSFFETHRDIGENRGHIENYVPSVLNYVPMCFKKTIYTVADLI